MSAWATANFMAFWILAEESGRSVVLPRNKNGPGRLRFQYSRSSSSSRGEAGTIPLSGDNVQLPSPAVDVRNLQMRGFAEPQTCGVAGHQYRSMFGIFDTC